MKQIVRIADRYFDVGEIARARIWPFRAYTAPERRIAAAMVAFLVVINQVDVAILARLNFFNRAFAVQHRNGTEFWDQLLLCFMPYAPNSLYGRGLAKLKMGDTAGGEADMAAARALLPGVDDQLASCGIK